MENVQAGRKPTPARSRQGVRKNKKSGPERQGSTLGGKKKQEKDEEEDEHWEGEVWISIQEEDEGK